MIVIGAVSGCMLGGMSVALKQYVARYPKSRLARDMKDGCDRQLYHYITPLVSMVVGCFLCVVAVICWRDPEHPALDVAKDWWYGAPTAHWAFTATVGLGAGHYVQDMLTNNGVSPLLFAHHVAAVTHAFCLQATSSWAGALLTWSFVYEAGSLFLNLGYVGTLPRWVGHWAALLTSIVGMVVGVFCLVWRFRELGELNCCAWFCITVLLLLGVGRIQDAVVCLLDLAHNKKVEAQEAAEKVGREVRRMSQGAQDRIENVVELGRLKQQEVAEVMGRNLQLAEGGLEKVVELGRIKQQEVVEELGRRRQLAQDHVENLRELGHQTKLEVLEMTCKSRRGPRSTSHSPEPAR